MPQILCLARSIARAMSEFGDSGSPHAGRVTCVIGQVMRESLARLGEGVWLPGNGVQPSTGRETSAQKEVS